MIASRRRKPNIALLLVFLLTLSFSAQAAGLIRLQDAVTLPEAPIIQSDYAILVEAKSGTVLYEKNAYAKAEPASITKILTALLTVENCSLDETLTFSYRATHEILPGSSTIARTEGEIMTVEECLYGLLVASANEVAQGLAEHVSGSLESFAALMTLRAAELGAVNSNFTNAHGLPDEDHYTCAYDMALITREALKYEALVTIMGTEKYQIPPTNKHDEITYLQMHHPLLTNGQNLKYPYAVAGKTGYTDQALNTLVTYAKQGSLDLISVVMHGDGLKTTGEDSIVLLNYGFQNFSCHSLSSAESVMQNADDSFLGSNLLQLSFSGDAYCTLPKDLALTDLRTEVVLLGKDSGSDALATRIYYLGDQEVGRCNLKATPREERIVLTPVERVAPSDKEVLRKVHLGLPLIYWILIGGGALILLILTLITVAVLKALKRRRRRQAQARRAMGRISEDG